MDIKWACDYKMTSVRAWTTSRLHVSAWSMSVCGCHVGSSRDPSSVQTSILQSSEQSRPRKNRAAQTRAAIYGGAAAGSQPVWQRGALFHAVTWQHAGHSVWTEGWRPSRIYSRETCQEGRQAWRQEAFTSRSTSELTGWTLTLWCCHGNMQHIGRCFRAQYVAWSVYNIHGITCFYCAHK